MDNFFQNDFKGIRYRLCDYWFNVINLNEYINKPINYLEIGTLCGANLISVSKTYGINENSKLYCIDPWEDYTEYNEYKSTQQNNYTFFLHNIKKSGEENKIITKRGYSNIEIPKLEDNFFDIIYIDGNHEPEYVLEDAVLSFRKLKPNGILIFDDYGWGGPDLTQRGIDSFMFGYYKRIKILKIGEQVFIQKL
jgi:predicted O-methyltransferase YrrM